MNFVDFCESLPKEFLGLKVQLMCNSIPKLLSGVPLTIELVLISLLIGFFLALGLALMRLSKNRFLNVISRSYVFYFRGTPLNSLGVELHINCTFRPKNSFGEDSQKSTKFIPMPSLHLC